MGVQPLRLGGRFRLTQEFGNLVEVRGRIAVAAQQLGKPLVSIKVEQRSLSLHDPRKVLHGLCGTVFGTV